VGLLGRVSSRFHPAPNRLVVFNALKVGVDSPASLNARIYIVGILMFSFLEVYWGWFYASSRASVSGIVLSVCIYAIAMAPVFWIRRPIVSLVLMGIATVCCLPIYILMNVYARFFIDYPSLKVIGYAGQVASISDSVWSLVDESHAISIVTVTLLWALLLRSYSSCKRSSD
jgi:hypothetical protein